MSSIGQMSIEELLQYSYTCDCGRVHSSDIKTVVISSRALAETPRIIQNGGWKKPFIIADCHTYTAAGRAVADHLDAAGIPHSQFVFDDEDLVPDEHAIGSILMRFDQTCDVILAVGSGTINDMSRFVSSRLRLPYVIVATAPSMDGYASSVAPLITNNLKTTYSATVPKAIIADVDVLAQAPQAMIAAGFADILGKYTCLVDWKLSALINGEYYCDAVVDMTKKALARTVALRDQLAQRDKQAVQRLMEALILTGVAMSYVGTSRPASGAEHHLSHFWEMRFLFEGRKPVLHGTKVGIACRLVLKLYDYLRSQGLQKEQIPSLPIQYDFAAWEAEIKRAYGKGAAEVLELERTAKKNDLKQRQERLHAAAEHWDEIQELIGTLPTSAELAAHLQAVHGAAFPQEVGLTAATVWDGIVYCKEVRNRYTILQLLWDLGLLEQYANRLVKEEYQSDTETCCKCQ